MSTSEEHHLDGNIVLITQTTVHCFVYIFSLKDF